MKKYDKNKLWDCRKYTKQPLANWKTNRIGGNSEKKTKTKQIRGRGSVLDMEIQGLFHTNILLQGLKWKVYYNVII